MPFFEFKLKRTVHEEASVVIHADDVVDAERYLFGHHEEVREEATWIQQEDDGDYLIDGVDKVERPETVGWYCADDEPDVQRMEDGDA